VCVCVCEMKMNGRMSVVWKHERTKVCENKEIWEKRMRPCLHQVSFSFCKERHIVVDIFCFELCNSTSMFSSSLGCRKVHMKEQNSTIIEVSVSSDHSLLMT
jgi:hypothetical protein